MPQTWADHWPLPDEPSPDRIAERDAAVQTLGNLTLVTNKLNPSMSNSSWQVKQRALNEHSVLLLNSRLIEQSPDSWDEQKIAMRTKKLLDAFKTVWPRPEPEVGAI